MEKNTQQPKPQGQPDERASDLPPQDVSAGSAEAVKGGAEPANSPRTAEPASSPTYKSTFSGLR